MHKFEKVYSVEFMEYTNAMKDTVSDWDGSFSTRDKEHDYLETGREPFLVRESEFEKYSKYGRGFRHAAFVGRIVVEDK